MNRIAHSYGLHDTYSFVTSTAIIFSLNDRTNTRLIRIRERTTDLEKIALTNSLSRKISRNELTIDEENLNLFICAEHHCNIHFTKLFAAAIACGFFLFMFGGVASDCWIAVIAGGAAFLTFSLVQRFIQIKFFSESVASRCRHHDCSHIYQTWYCHESKYHYHFKCNAACTWYINL